MFITINYLIDKSFFEDYEIVLIMGDDSMFFRVESNIKSNMKYKVNIEDVKFDDIVIKATPVNYFIIYDFYLFLINELEILRKILMEKYSHKDVKYLLSRINSFLEKFDFDTFFLENFEDLMMQLNESSLSKLNKIIEILKEEYEFFKKMDPGLDVYSDMIDWIEDALYLLKGFAKKLATSQEEIIHKTEFYDFDEYKNGKSPSREGSYAAFFPSI